MTVPTLPQHDSSLAPHGASMSHTSASQGFYLGKTWIASQVVLAPMAGITDVVFRGFVRQWAPHSLICTEMISSNGLVYSKRWDSPILQRTLTDHPIAYQLAAHREEVLLEAAHRIIQDYHPVSIDLNMGCPVKKITGNFEGCSLMKSPEHAFKLIKALTSSIDTPVTVKFRLGWDEQSKNYLEFGQMCQEAGASMVTLHARTRAQGYQPGCDWDAFGHLKQALNIPVVANGDITSLEDVRHVLKTYQVDAVMIGRGTQGKPWLIGHLHEALTQALPALPTMPLTMIIEVALAHAEALAEHQGEDRACRELRAQLPWYLKGFKGASLYRQQLTQIKTLEDIRHVLTLVQEAHEYTHDVLNTL
ncbi:MAG: tRNA dihydrouridine synthase DusB [Vampirovibrionales bacterium]